MSVVLDSSVTLAWIYPDETTDAVRQLFDAVTENGAVVPALWRIEVANALTIAMRRGRIHAGLRAGAVYDATYLELAHRRSLPLATLDIELSDAAWTLGVRLAGEV